MLALQRAGLHQKPFQVGAKFSHDASTAMWAGPLRPGSFRSSWLGKSTPASLERRKQTCWTYGTAA